MTLLAINRANQLHEFPVSGNHVLKEHFGMFDGQTVYGYIINRKSIYKQKHYGWALPRECPMKEAA